MSALDIVLRDFISADQWELNKDAARAELAQLRAELTQLRQERDALRVTVAQQAAQLEQAQKILEDLQSDVPPLYGDLIIGGKITLSLDSDSIDNLVDFLAANAPQPERAEAG